MPHTHPTSIYGAPASDGELFSPFHLDHQPMERLLLINFEKDPDRIYIAFEPQVFDDPKTGRGFIVLAYRTDGRVDVYHQPGLDLAHVNFDIVGKGLASMVEAPLRGAKYEVGRAGLDVDFAFEDQEGRAIEVRIEETHPKPRRPFTLVAPLGSGTADPPSFPIFYLFGFYFLRRAGTRAHVRIGGRDHRIDTLPIPLDGMRMYFTRYAPATFLASWNPTHHGPVRSLRPRGDGLFEADSVTYRIADNGGHREIAEMRRSYGDRDVRIAFDPPVPELRALRDGASAEGTFVILGDPSAGTLGGTYHVTRAGEQVRVRIHPSQGWSPIKERFSLRLLYRFVPILRRWPTTYTWNATIDLTSEAAPTMEARWERVGTT